MNLVPEVGCLKIEYYNKQNNQYILSKGYGKVLLTHIETYMRNNGIIYTILMPMNHKLIPYYTKHGYTECIINTPFNDDNTSFTNHIYV
jgi:predicted acetyltransferase